MFQLYLIERKHKKCTKCGKLLNIAFFHKHCQSKDDRKPDCKNCRNTKNKIYCDANKSKIKAYRDRNKERNDLYKREYYENNKSLLYNLHKEWVSNNREKDSELKRNWAAKNKHKRKAHGAVSYAIQSKKLTRQPCCICGKSGAEAHHPDYDKVLDVVWLCTEHHAELHKKQRRELGG